MKLTPRLKCVYEMLGSGNVFIDVGCDHGYLPVKLLEDGKYRRAVLSDINPGPLDAARKNVVASSVSDRCALVLSDGFESIEKPLGEYSAAVCGMGGDLIARIVTESDVAKGASRLVLQPMTKEDHLRGTLWENGFEIISERASAEGSKAYIALLCRYTGELAVRGGVERVTGIRAAREVSREMFYYLTKLAENRAGIARGLSDSGRDNSKIMAEYRALNAEAEYTAAALDKFE